jgi:hypothetical protein
VNIAGDIQEIVVGFDQEGLVSSLVEMPHPLVLSKGKI